MIGEELKKSWLLNKYVAELTMKEREGKQNEEEIVEGGEKRKRLERMRWDGWEGP